MDIPIRDLPGGRAGAVRRHRRCRRAAAVAVGAAVAALGLAAPAGAAPTNIALNPSSSGQPSPLESSPGWGGGARPWEIVDGYRTYADWPHGLAFTGGRGSWAGQPCGIRQATITFGANQTFDKVILWHHGDQHIPATAELHYGDGATWKPITFTRIVGAVREGGAGSVSDEYSFAAVTASKVRWTIDNCGPTASGDQLEHGWLYEFEVMSATSGTGASDATHVNVAGGSLTVEAPEIGDFAAVTLDGRPQTTPATMSPFGVSDATGTGAGWKLTAQATRFAEVDGSGSYVPSGKTLPPESLSIAGVSVSAGDTTSPPPSVLPGPYVLDGAGAVTILAASAGNGMGQYVVTPEALTLAVPADAFARTYRSDVTLSLVSGP